MFLTHLGRYDYGMLPFYTKLAGKVRNIVVFNGDTDPDVQVRHTWFLHSSSFALRSEKDQKGAGRSHQMTGKNEFGFGN